MKKPKRPMNVKMVHYLRIFAIVIGGILFYAIINNLKSVSSAISFVMGIISPITIGLCIAFVLNIPLRFLETKVFKKLTAKNGKIWSKLKRPLCLTLSVLFVLTVMGTILSFVLPKLVSTCSEFFLQLPNHMNTLTSFINNIVTEYNLPIDSNRINIDWDWVSAQAGKLFSNTDGDVIQGTVTILIDVFNGVVNVILGIVFAIYVLASKEQLGKLAKSILYAVMSKEKASNVISVVVLSNKAFSGFVAGQCIESLLIGFLCLIGMLVIDFKYALLVASIIAVTAFVPIFGAIAGAIISAALLLVANPTEPLKAVIFLIFILVLQQIESNVIYPRIMGKQVGLPGIWVLAAVTIGGGLFGVMGIIVSVPLCSVLYTLLQRWVIQRLEEKKICHRTMSHDASEPNHIVEDLSDYELDIENPDWNWVAADSKSVETEKPVQAENSDVPNPDVITDTPEGKQSDKNTK